MQTRYKLTRRTLGNVFRAKAIITTTRDVVGYLLKEERDPLTQKRKYVHVPFIFVGMEKPIEPEQKIDYPKFPINSWDMDSFNPPGRYLIKVVDAKNKSKSFGSVLFVNKGEGYLI